jgi:hypothetical protein
MSLRDEDRGVPRRRFIVRPPGAKTQRNREDGLVEDRQLVPCRSLRPVRSGPQTLSQFDRLHVGSLLCGLQFGACQIIAGDKPHSFSYDSLRSIAGHILQGSSGRFGQKARHGEAQDCRDSGDGEKAA